MATLEVSQMGASVGYYQWARKLIGRPADITKTPRHFTTPYVYYWELTSDEVEMLRNLGVPENKKFTPCGVSDFIFGTGKNDYVILHS